MVSKSRRRKEMKPKWWVTLAAFGSWLALVGLLAAWGIGSVLFGSAVAVSSVGVGVKDRFRRCRKGRDAGMDAGEAEA